MHHNTSLRRLVQSTQFPTESLLDSLAAVPEEAVWLAKLKSRRTRAGLSA